MLRLVEFEAEKLEAIKRLQNELEAMLPVFENAADLIRSELEPFRKYGREPYVGISRKNGLIQLRVTVQKRTAKSVSFNWLNETYRVTSSGGLVYNDGYEDHQMACTVNRIALHFLALHRAKITDRLEKLLPH